MSPGWLLVLLPGLVLVQAQGQAQHGSIAGTPFSTPLDVEAGLQSFRSQCAACHGLDAAGGAVAPSLTTGTFKHGGSDEALYGVITKGVAGTAMTAFNLNGREVWQLIAFLRSANIAKAAGKAAGDAAKGARVYGSNGCARCHTNGNGGGFTGPDLSEVGSRRSLMQIESSIVDPNAEVEPDYWSVTAQTKAGQTVTGARLNEDMDSIQIRERQGRLRTLLKADLAKFDIVRTSPMPSLKGKLNATELQDLVAYLASLRAPANAEAPKK
jgi:putative heme-binding domain-containing protein